MTDLHFRPAVELLAAIRTRAISSRELTAHFLQRIERLNPKINAVVTLDAERALARAAAADAALANGTPWGPLHGLPMTIKDTFETAGVRTTAGASELAAHVPETDAVAVARLVAAGAIILGKTNTPLYAGDAQTYNAVFGTTNNPWDLTRTTGGSSGGAAAALTAGFTGLELGSDIGGSIRTPSHCCGTYGHKPSYGIVPGRGHVPGPPGTLSETDLGVFGPMGRSAADLALELDILAGPDSDEGTAWRLALPPPRRARLRDYRFAAWLDDPACPTDTTVRTRLEAVVSMLRKAGATVDDQARPGFALADAFRDYARLLWPIISMPMAREQFEDVQAMARQLAPDDDSHMARFARYATQTHREWIVANEWRARYRAQWAEFFRDYDALLCPAVPVPAFPHDHSEPLIARTITVNGGARSYADVIIWSGAIGNFAYLPATVAPAGRTPEGLPIGIQIVGPYLEDRTPIDVATRLAELIGGFEPPPGY